MKKHTILIVDDEEAMCRILSRLLSTHGYEVLTTGNGHEALKTAHRQSISLLITDLMMPGMNGLQLLTDLKKFDPDIPVILITAYGTVDTAVQAMKGGAYDYILKPFDNDEIVFTVEKALKNSAASTKKMRSLHGKLLIGTSPNIKAVYEKIDKIATSSATVLISGETGTGKELVAREIHNRSDRCNGSFICVNCAALPDTLLESELFGYEKGAFTGAVAQKCGRFELAGGGSLLLDEIGDMSPLMQTKLLRVLEDKKVVHLGGNTEITIDVRIMAATNKDLAKACEDGSFRQDLYYRINVLNIALPPLREHKEDISEIATYFVEHYCRKDDHAVKTLSNEAAASLMAYHWPGNIRELENVIARAVAMAPENIIQPVDLGLPVTHTSDTPTGSLKDTVRSTTSQLEKDAIAKALEEHGGNRTRAAKALGISRRSLLNKIKQYDLDI
jgi:DNA-binding NtrC family response regulator